MPTVLVVVSQDLYVQISLEGVIAGIPVCKLG
jgi:hypothetical protein